MTILQILVLLLLAVVAGRLPRGRQPITLAVSAFAVFWLQSAEPVKALRFWLPFATLAITVLAWAVTASPAARDWHKNWPAAAILIGVTCLAAFGARIPWLGALAEGEPRLRLLLAALAFVAVMIYLSRWSAWQSVARLLAVLGILGAFIVLKTPSLNGWFSARVAALSGAVSTADLTALSWLGFSYLAFRLLHTIRDRQAGRLPDVSLMEYANYAVFFPAFTAGPIDRVERFVQDLRQPAALCDEDWVYAGRRILMGLIKKFVLADLLAVIAINDVFVAQAKGAGWLWLFMYAYALRIYLDFSGYTDMAIGMSRLLGVRLPENFASPYLKPNITQFWNSWHITLTQWFRAYVFNPLTRALRRRALPAWLIILVGQLVVMLLIGLWHGIAWGFVAWGLWHAAGLFLHNRWSELLRGREPVWSQGAVVRRFLATAGALLTFNFVSVGWLFFTLSTPAIAWLAIRKMLGFA